MTVIIEYRDFVGVRRRPQKAVLRLWRRPWRLAGGAAILAGLATVATVAAPDVLVSGNGRLMAVRAADGGLMVSARGARPSCATHGSGARAGRHGSPFPTKATAPMAASPATAWVVTTAPTAGWWRWCATNAPWPRTVGLLTCSSAPCPCAVPTAEAAGGRTP